MLSYLGGVRPGGLPGLLLVEDVVRDGGAAVVLAGAPAHRQAVRRGLHQGDGPGGGAGQLWSRGVDLNS